MEQSLLDHTIKVGRVLSVFLNPLFYNYSNDKMYFTAEEVFDAYTIYGDMPETTKDEVEEILQLLWKTHCVIMAKFEEDGVWHYHITRKYNLRPREMG